MRVLRVAQKLYPDVTGGGPYHVHAMSRDQAAAGHDVTVLTVGRDDGLPRRETRDGYTVLRRPATVELLGNEISLGVANALRRVGEFDVVHAHSHLYVSTNLATASARLADVPLAITNHGLFSQTAPEPVFEAYLRTLGRLTFDSADAVFCYTGADRDRLRAYGVDARVAVVPNGVDTGRFHPDGPVDDRVAGDPAVLFVGRLVEGKRPRDAVAALARLRERRPAARLTVCGEGPLAAAVGSAAAEFGVGDAVDLLGHVPHGEMPGVYRGADAFLLPSRAEGFPRTVLEAMATDVPVVVSDLAGLGAVVDGAGETVPVGDVAGFARALDCVLAGTGRSPRDVVADDHAWADTVAETTRVLAEIADGGTGR